MVIGDILHHEFYFDAKFLRLLKADIIKLLKKEGFYLFRLLKKSKDRENVILSGAKNLAFSRS